MPPTIPKPKNRIMEGLRQAFQGLQRPTDENVPKATILGGLGGAGEAVVDMLDDPNGQIMDFMSPMSVPAKLPITAMQGLKRFLPSKSLVTPNLPMDEASRLARAAEQGYTHDMYHGTQKSFDEFSDPIKGNDYGSGDFGIHVTPRPETATKASGYDSILDQPVPSSASPQIMPLKVKIDRTLNMNRDLGIWKSPHNWNDLRNPNLGGLDQLSDDPSTLGWLVDEADTLTRDATPFEYSQLNTSWQHKLKEILQQRGYDSISYPNKIEGEGELSYLLLDPRQIKSRFARFDPAAFGRTRNIMSSVAPPVAGLAALQQLMKDQDK